MTLAADISHYTRDANKQKSEAEAEFRFGLVRSENAEAIGALHVNGRKNSVEQVFGRLMHFFLLWQHYSRWCCDMSQYAEARERAGGVSRRSQRRRGADHE